tara:strand:+ start:345 stop:701 length:357 start_codon:yes stop_codon:yes gene_type:complete
MSFKINEKIENNILTIEVNCLRKTFLTDKTIVLTTKKILDTIKEKYNISETLSEPSHTVGNTTRSKIRLSGIWKFKITTPNKEKKEPAIEKPKRKYTRKTKKPEDSIRNRISKLSKKD